MNTEFDDIRCYNDNEVAPALARLSEEKQFMKVLSTIYPLLPKDVIRQRLLSFKSIPEFQKELIYPFLQYIEANLTKGIELQLPENFDNAQPYLYISNHRDIILDSALLCAKLIEKGMDTVEIAIGDNLLVFPWIEELVRVNKSFIVKRGLSPRQILESSKKLSSYIRFTINEKQQSIWIAQREGRAKDSNDRTQESLLKMMNMSGNASIAENLAQLNICPLSISYEYDPCDFLKAREFQQKRDNPAHKKTPMDDLINMQTGVMGFKGRVIYRAAGNINSDILKIGTETSDKSEVYRRTAELIDKHIHTGYEIYNVNKISYDLLTGENRFSKDYDLLEKLDFEKYLEKQITKVDLADKDENFLRKKMLEMYANPLINHIKASE